MTKPPNRTAYKRVLKAIGQSRLEVEKLIDQMPKDDFYSLGLLGPIRSELRGAENSIRLLAENAGE
jgi:hypothetical protein